MSEFIFTSPGVKFKEIDLTTVSKSVGLTTLGVVGECPKGPAFQPIPISDKGEFLTRFGNQSIEKFPTTGSLKYQLPYVANAYLSESNQLYVTRVLGLSGFDCGKGWAVIVNAGVNPTTTGYTASIVNGSASFSNNQYLGTSLYQVGDTGTSFTGFTKTSNTNFSGVFIAFTATTISNGSGTVTTKKRTITGTSYSEYENMVVAVLRSRASVTDNVNAAETVTFNANTVTITANTTNIGSGNFLGNFTLKATNTLNSKDVAETYNVSLDPNSSNFIPNVIGSTPKDKSTKLYVEAIYPDLIEKLDSLGYGYGVKTTLIDLNSSSFTNYKQQFQTPETPWVVSQLRGNAITRLFKFTSISDGNAANQEIKIAIANIDPATLTFDVYIRSFSDTDENPVYLETYSRCSLIQGTTNYIGARIGTSDGSYDIVSKYVIITMADNIPEDSFPAGFEGYNLKDFSLSGTSTTSGLAGVAPKIFYKKAYTSTDKTAKIYLGMSNAGYDGTNLKGTGINQNLFNYNGASGFKKSKGFHMDSGATSTYYNGTDYIGQFETGAASIKNVQDITSTSPYFNIKTRKFILVPAGGFDGWDEHRGGRSYGDLYAPGMIYDGVSNPDATITDFQAWTTAINTFSNPEEVSINVFATPGINWSDNNTLVKNTIDLIENQRADSIYIIDSPDITIPTSIGDNKDDVLAAEDIVDLLNNADIDSSYAATYFPYIQINDTQNNVNVFLPPTSEICKGLAYSDKTSAVWYAPAGLTRGVTDAKKSKYKLSLDARDVLQKGRINPLADFSGTGTAIFGQKTLQVKDSALNRINVRRLLLQAKVLISNVAVRLLFEPNDQSTMDSFISKVNPILDTIKRERGLIDFKVVMDDSLNTAETLDRNELYGNIYLKPTTAAEYIGIDFILTPRGASFNG